MNEASIIVRDLLLFKKYSKLCNQWEDWNFGYWGDAPDWANEALDKCSSIKEKYGDMIDWYNRGIDKVVLRYYPEGLDVPTFATLYGNDYLLKLTIRNKCTRRGIKYVR